jgi:hypothetical protein
MSTIKLSSWMFKGVKGLNLPQRSASNTGNVGTYIDSYIKTQLNISDVSSIVDLEAYGIEIKSKDINTNSDWSIGSMTLEDILKTPYSGSSVCKKLQALLLVDTDDTFRIVKDIGLYYFDMPEIQKLLKDSYESARSQIQSVVTNHASNVAYQVSNGNPNAVLNKVKFDSFQKFHGAYGKFEFTNNGTSFMFRISQSQMRHLTTLAATSTPLITFE